MLAVIDAVSSRAGMTLSSSLEAVINWPKIPLLVVILLI